MTQIKPYVFFVAFFDQYPILTCPGMTNYHNILDLEKTCCVNCTELHLSKLTIISIFLFGIEVLWPSNPLPDRDQISFLR